MVKPRMEGGLGVHHIKSKVMAILIKAFLETAINGKFITNVFHNALFRWNILGETNIEHPVNAPYYWQQFYSIIKRVHDEGKHKVDIL